MSATQTLSQQRQAEELDLGGGSSSGIHFNALTSSKPLTILSLLEQPVTFVKQRQKSRASEIPYKAINERLAPAATANGVDASPAASKPALTNGAPARAAAPSSVVPGSPFASISPATGWVKPYPIGSGLDNEGNTCFLNSALQCLLHTPPLVRYFEEKRHDPATCRYRAKKGFCMTCTMPVLINNSFKKNPPHYTPVLVTRNLRKIAQHFRIGRQEDSHEFLRFCIDNMQLSEVFGKDPKMPQAIKDSTFVHQIFGGRLRSRVKCMSCQHPSDTFDSVLDLSLDLNRNTRTIKDALAEYTKVDILKGQNKYKCEKCKKLVVAEKSFSINEAPMVLTVHLKRFTAAGRKISEPIGYPEVLDLKPYMSDGVPAPSYRLFGTINHSGGGPHSGHYTAFVKDSKGAWNNMNDSFVQRCNPPLGQKNAYVLFYCRERGDLLKSAINGGTTTGGQGVNGHGKRPRESLDGAAKGSPASAQGRAANGVNGSAAGPSPAKKPHLANGHAHAQAQQSGPRPPTVITASTTAPNGAAPPPSSSAPPLVGGRGSGVFQSASAGAGAGGVGLSKGQKKKQAKKLKLSTVGKLKPRMLRE